MVFRLTYSGDAYSGLQLAPRSAQNALVREPRPSKLRVGGSSYAWR